MPTPQQKSPEGRIFARALARKEGRRLPDEDQELVVHGRPAPPDEVRLAITRGDVLLEDVPVSQKMDDVMSTAVETSWHELGPSDLDAMRAQQAGERFVSPQEAIALEKARARDPEFEKGYSTAMADLSKAARDAAREAEGNPVNRVRPLPLPTSDLMSEIEADHRIQPGVPAPGGRPVLDFGDAGEASVVRDATPARLAELDGGVTRTQTP
jgi:hypothetical protein